MRGRRFSFEFYSLVGPGLNDPSVGHADITQDGDEDDSTLKSSICEFQFKSFKKGNRNQSHHNESFHVDVVGVSNPVAE